MSGPSTVYASAEMYSRTAEALSKARRELLRLECHQNDGISVEREGVNLNLTYKSENFTVNPCEIVIFLESIHSPKTADEVWLILTNKHLAMS